jgi:5-methylcytosine-specific restriction protein A
MKRSPSVRGDSSRSYRRFLQRQSEGCAASVIERLVPKPRARRSVARFFASAIRCAASTTSWALTLHSDSLRLNVGPVQLATLSAGVIWFCTTGRRRKEWPGWVQRVGSGAVVYKSVDLVSSQYRINVEQVSRLPHSVRAAFLEYVSQAASRRAGKSPWHAAHSPGVLAFLERYLDLDSPLPRPVHGSGSESAQEGGEELPEGVYKEGAVKWMLVNVFERDQAAKAACLARWGFACSGCGETMGARYGSIADGLIEVHHLIPLSSIRRTYTLDPVKDLRPVCPNCHAVVHRGRPPLSIEELRSLVTPR